MQRFQLSDEGVKHIAAYPLTTAEEKAANWRPGGWQLITAHEERGEVFVLMHPNGQEGTHKNPGLEIWVFDADTGEKKRVLPLQLPAVSIAATADYIIATNVEMNLDVYDIKTGDYVRLIGQTAHTPLLVYNIAGQ